MTVRGGYAPPSCNIRVYGDRRIPIIISNFNARKAYRYYIRNYCCTLQHNIITRLHIIHNIYIYNIICTDAGVESPVTSRRVGGGVHTTDVYMRCSIVYSLSIYFYYLLITRLCVQRCIIYSDDIHMYRVIYSTLRRYSKRDGSGSVPRDIIAEKVTRGLGRTRDLMTSNDRHGPPSRVRSHPPRTT